MKLERRVARFEAICAELGEIIRDSPFPTLESKLDLADMCSHYLALFRRKLPSELSAGEWERLLGVLRDSDRDDVGLLALNKDQANLATLLKGRDDSDLRRLALRVYKARPRPHGPRKRLSQAHFYREYDARARKYDVTRPDVFGAKLFTAIFRPRKPRTPAVFRVLSARAVRGIGAAL